MPWSNGSDMIIRSSFGALKDNVILLSDQHYFQADVPC